jgi:molybdopterin synthase catalytic subunit
MQIQVRFFAVLRERVRRDGQALELPDGATVAAAVDALAAEHDAVGAMRGRFQTAVNHAMVPPETALADGDELALIPPVAGGTQEGDGVDHPKPVPARGPGEAGVSDSRVDAPVAGGAGDRVARMVHDRAPSLDVCVAAVKTPETGGIATFTGCVRRRNQGRDVERLEYEAYDEMANKVLRELCEAIEAEIPDARLAVEHRAGVLAVGDVAVVIAAAAPHRAEAFAACREMIERLKRDVPIWKKEVGPDGEEWIGQGP